MRFRTRHWLGLALIIVVFDQATKSWAGASLNYAEPLPICPGLNLTLLFNTGAAFSFLSEASGWQRWFLSAVALVVSLIIVFLLRSVGPAERWLPISLSLILGGALGNVWDRLKFGYVIDFVQVYYQQWSWPAFNVADSAICVGAVMLLLSGWRKQPG